MSKYYLVHSVVDPSVDKILKILKDGYLFSSYTSKQQGISGIPLNYVHLMLLGDGSIFHGGVNFILNPKILFHQSFKYALQWIGSSIKDTIKVNHKHDDINKILDEINSHTIKTNSHDNLFSHEILLKKVNLHKYLVAVCCKNKLSSEIINYINEEYPNVQIIDKFPESAQDLNHICI